jgi:hypothetical protein
VGRGLKHGHYAAVARKATVSRVVIADGLVNKLFKHV